MFRGGTQLNNMLGELDVIGTRREGTRRPAREHDDADARRSTPAGRELVIGSAGSVRLAGAIAQVTWRFLRGTHVADAIRAPRLHVEGTTLHLEGGWPDDEVAALPPTWDVNRWDGLNLFFGGVQAVEHTAASSRSRPPATRGAAGWGSSSRDHDPARHPHDAHALVELAESVGREDGRWILGTGPWRPRSPTSAGTCARSSAIPTPRCSSPRTASSIVGRLSLSRDPHPASRHVADLGLMVAASHRRQGVGTLLLEQAVAWARESGVRKLELHVFPWNEPALGLYESFGFEREGYRKRHYERGGELVDAILMAYFVDGALASY